MKSSTLNSLDPFDFRWNLLAVCLLTALIFTATTAGQIPKAPESSPLNYQRLSDLPDSIGVAGAIAGVHHDALIVAGGANFAPPDAEDLWTVDKRFLDRVWVLQRVSDSGSEEDYAWSDWVASFRLAEPVAYSSVVSTDSGLIVMGGEKQDGPTRRAFLLSLDSSERASGELALIENDWAIPDLPVNCTGGGAAVIEGAVYLVAGQVRDQNGNRSASRSVYRLDLDVLKLEASQNLNEQSDLWQPVPSWPASGPPRMFPLVTSQHDGYQNRLYIFGGRHVPSGRARTDENLRFLSDGWSFDPKLAEQGKAAWKRLTDSPVPLAAGAAAPVGPAHILVPTYATGELIQRVSASGQTMEEFAHPGFPKLAYAYHTITDTWTEFGETPSNPVTTPAVNWNGRILLVSGELRPRVRSQAVWAIDVSTQSRAFGAINLVVVVLYLLAMVGVGVFFSFRNTSTDDYFRGGKSVPWWAAGCSIFATMLSSITYMAVPAKAFAQDWVYAMGSLMIVAVAPIAVYIALPFFRYIDATSAYEYLEKRFNRAVRLIGSGSFTLFHVFRMAVVLALAALALASVTPFSPGQCVVVMGVLSIVYCTLGGIEAVIWTDTIQTLILLGGAMLCLGFAINGSAVGSFEAAMDAGKTHLVNLDFGGESFMIMAIWVVILGGLGQNVASYTADQAVVQRYMTTPDRRRAANSIWLNAMLSVPASAMFFLLGTTFWMFYRTHPEKLDPTIATDRILPLFVSQELPAGLAGLVVAGIFAAAQSTVSTSMNSGATTVLTDFLRPFNACRTERAYLWSARAITLILGILGTLTGLLFVDPQIKSLFDHFIGILGLFMGVLTGLFALGATTKRANGWGSLVGAVVSLGLMVSIVLAANNQLLLGIDFRAAYDAVGWTWYRVNGYLYAFVGISVCYVVGYLASFAFPRPTKSLQGLTLFTLAAPDDE